MAKIEELKKYLTHEFSDEISELPENTVPRKPLAACQCWEKSLLLFGIYQKQSEQVCVYLHLGRALFHKRMVRAYPDPNSAT